jgi:ankyrin repeat/BTB/POZ domain-containing protein 1
VVQYLIANGARCEEGSRDGERCVYGALTDDIREYLLKSQVITPESKTRDEYQSFCERFACSLNIYE